MCSCSWLKNIFAGFAAAERALSLRTSIITGAGDRVDDDDREEEAPLINETGSSATKLSGSTRLFFDTDSSIHPADGRFREREGGFRPES